MAIRFTIEGDEVHILPHLGDDEEEDWPDPLKTYLAPPVGEIAERVRELGDGVPLVLRLPVGATCPLDRLADIVRTAGAEGHDVVLLPPEREVSG